MARSLHRTGRRWRRAKTQMHTIYGHVCVHCGHDGAGEADHIIPLKHWPDQPIDPHAMRPSHGSNYPCPTCGRHCNQERGTRTQPAPLITSEDW